MMRLAWTLTFAAMAAALPAQETPDLEPSPPPDGACDADVAQHVLAETLGTWHRAGPPSSLSRDRLPEVVGKTLGAYQPTCGATAAYGNATGPGTADAMVIAFETRLDALGFFSAQRTDGARLVVLTSAAYRDSGAIHAHSGRYYLRVTADGAPTEALPADQYLAARLEMRLPQPGARPRLLEVIPRGWITPLTVSYAPTHLLGDDLSPMALTVEHLLGTRRVRVTVMQVEDQAAARLHYTLLLQHTLQAARVREVRQLGEEAFISRLDDSAAIGMRQDEFVAYVTGIPDRGDAEAVMRLVGTAIRTSRPLPGVTTAPDAAPRSMEEGGEP